MRFALVTELDMDSGKRRCGVRSPGGARIDGAKPDGGGVRRDAAEPADAVKARVVLERVADVEPNNAAKGQRGLASSGAISC